MSAEHFTANANKIRAHFLSPTAVRITHAPPDSEIPFDRPWLSHVLLPQPPVEPNSPQLNVSVNDGLVSIVHPASRFTFHESAPPRFGPDARRLSPRLVLDISATEVRVEDDRADDGVSLSFAIEPGEGFYGWGEWFNAFRRERGTVRLRIRDAIALLQDRETYAALPVFLSSRGYAIWLLNSHPAQFAIDPERGVLKIDAAGPNADYVFIYGPSFKEMLRTYTALTGRPALPPRWAFGLMVTGYPQEHQDTVLQRVQEHRARSLPLDAVILDYHWEERFHNFKWRKALIPHPSSFIAGLQSLGIKLGLIVTPFINSRNRPFQRWLLNTLAGNLPKTQPGDDERALPEYADGRAKGYFAHDDARWWFGAGGMVDFTNPEAARWFNGLMQPRYDEGVQFFKNDDGEYLPAGARSHIGMSGREYHNLYGFFYSRALFEGMPEDRRPFVYARSTWVGSQRFPALFLGDQHPTFEHIRRTLRAGLNMSLLGFAHWTADVFGLDGTTTPETHRRYAQWALLNPIARYFWRPPEADATRFPWSHGAATEANFRKYAELRYRLLPYFYALAHEAHRTGIPPVRPVLLEFQADARFADEATQYMLGPSLLVAPIVEAGANSRRIALPEGRWHDWWTTDSHAGGATIEYAAPPDRLPMLARGGSLIPLGPPMQHIPFDHRFDELELHCFPPYPAAFTLYDDDGRTRGYLRGEYSITRISMEASNGKLLLVMGATQGRFPGEAESRRVTVVLHRASAPRGVRLDGQPWPEWEHDPVAQTVRVSAACATQRATRLDVEGAT
jgi:alpha-glucosidase (family GH31 glycosyl hydrolase)